MWISRPLMCWWRLWFPTTNRVLLPISSLTMIHRQDALPSQTVQEQSPQSPDSPAFSPRSSNKGKANRRLWHTVFRIVRTFSFASFQHPIRAHEGECGSFGSSGNSTTRQRIEVVLWHNPVLGDICSDLEVSRLRGPRPDPTPPSKGWTNVVSII